MQGRRAIFERVARWRLKESRTIYDSTQSRKD